MKARYLWLVAVAAVVGAALLTATAAASAAAILVGNDVAVSQEPQGPPPPGIGPHGRGGPGGPGGGLDRMVVELDLTQAQIEQLKALRDAARTASEPFEQQMRKAEDGIRAAIESGSFDEDAVRTLAAGESKANIELRVIGARTDAAILKLLTAEQREALKTMRPPRHGRGPELPFQQRLPR